MTERGALTGSGSAAFAVRLALLAAAAFVVVLTLLPLAAGELFSVRSVARWALWPVALAVVLGASVPWDCPRPASSTAAGLAMLWLVFVLGAPSHPRWHFARDVGLLAPGMSRDAVDVVMAEHVEGMFEQRLQPWPGETYYEPRDEHHSGDEFLVVTWADERASALRYARD